MRPCEISELIENCSPTFLSGIWDRKDWTEPPSSAQNPFSMIKNGSQALPQRGAAWNGNEKVCASFRRRWHRMVAYVGSFPAFFLRARTTTFFREKKLKKPRENCISLGLQLSLNLKFFGEWKIFAGRDLFISRIFLSPLTKSKIALTRWPRWRAASAHGPAFPGCCAASTDWLASWTAYAPNVAAWWPFSLNSFSIYRKLLRFDW